MRMIVVSAAVLAVLAGTPPAQQAVIAPALPMPDVGEDGPATAYLRAAEAALATGRTGEAQQALEMADFACWTVRFRWVRPACRAPTRRSRRFRRRCRRWRPVTAWAASTQIQAALDTIRTSAAVRKCIEPYQSG